MDGEVGESILEVEGEIYKGTSVKIVNDGLDFYFHFYFILFSFFIFILFFYF